MVAKQLGQAFVHTRLGVRLHSTASIIDAHEGPSMNWLDHCRIETERLGVAMADLVVAHVPEIVSTNQRFYGLDGAWQRKTVVEFPPLFEGAAGPQPVRLEAGAPIVFGTKVQRIKQPELFIKGVSEFMRRRPDWRGMAEVVCHDFDPDYGASVRALVPPAYQRRFSFKPPGPARTALMRPGALWVVPSRYESLNLTAYEAALGGATLVLNRACPAFGVGSPFVEGDSAWLFDGTSSSLADALDRAFDHELPRAPSWIVARPWYERAPAPTPTIEPAALSLDVVVRVREGLGVWPMITAMTHTRLPFRLTLLADDSTTGDGLHLARLAASSVMPADRVQTLQLSRAQSVDDVWRLALARKADVVLFLEEGMKPEPAFVLGGMHAMERHAGVAAVVPTVGFTNFESASTVPDWYATFVGTAPSLSLRENCTMHPYSLVRTAHLRDAALQEVSGAGLAWSLGARLSQSGARVLVTPAVGLYTSSAHDHAVYGEAPAPQLTARLVAALEQPHPGTRWATLVSPVHHAASHAPSARPSSLIDLGNEALKRFPLAHRAAKTLLHGLAGGRASDVPLRHHLAGRLQSLISR